MIGRLVLCLLCADLVMMSTDLGMISSDLATWSYHVTLSWCLVALSYLVTLWYLATVCLDTWHEVWWPCYSIWTSSGHPVPHLIIYLSPNDLMLFSESVRLSVREDIHSTQAVRQACAYFNWKFVGFQVSVSYYIHVNVNCDHSVMNSVWIWENSQ